jgi:hypothetical protein
MKSIRIDYTPLMSALWLLPFCLPAPATSLTNSFTTPYDYVANGIIGDTNWDGIYMNLGDIPNNNNTGGNGPGATTIANSGVTYPGYLGIQSQGTDWAGGDNDGFFVWKLVSGDFDVSVQSSPFTLSGGTWFDNRANNFCGLMVRAYKPDNSGAPYSPNTTNFVENYVMNWRFQEFGLNEVNEATDGARHEHTFPDSNSDTNSTRYYRIVRTSLTNFTFYTKTNAGDAWWQITNNLPAGGVRSITNLAGPLQVGIAQAAFNPATRDAVFTDFELSGPTVTFPAMPAAPSGLTCTGTNIGGSLTFSWTLGDPVHDQSLVIVRQSGPIQASPIQGTVYNANAAYGDPTTVLAAARECVVYNGTGTSVTVTNLAGDNLLYTVAVYEYSNSAAPVYNTASPQVVTNNGPGIITGVIASVAPTDLPLGGAALGTVLATFSSGSGTVDESGAATWSVLDPTVVSVNGRTFTALATGSTYVTGSFGAFNASALITVHAPTFTDNFGTYQDYVANGLQGSTWDGLFLGYGDVPLTTATDARKGSDGATGATSQCIANTNVLYMDAAGSSWFNTGNDGPYLFKIVTGDFQASVHVGPMSTINNCDGGIMARLFNSSNGSLQGGGAGTGGTESHVNWVKIQNGTPAVRRTIDSGGTTIINDPNTTDRWLLMQRINSTNFYLYGSTVSNSWIFVTNIVLAEASNSAPMEVGLEQEMRTASDGFVPFDTFMLDGPGITPPATPPPAASGITAVLNGDLSMTFNWVASDGAGNPVRSGLIMRAGGPITAFPTLAQAAAFGGTGTPVNFGTSGVDVGGGNWLTFVTGNPASSTNVTCTVKNLTPGTVYYAAVITFVGSGGTKSFNNVLPPSGATTTLQDGVLLSLVVVPPPMIPRGGIGKAQVLGTYQGGAVVDISGFTSLYSSNNAVVITTNPPTAGFGGVLTGLGNGTAAVAAVYKNFTNVFNVTVGNPTFTDEFSVNHDYLANGVGGTGWEGAYNTTASTNPVPDSPYVAGAGDQTSVADANISSNGVLTVTQYGLGWENDNSGGYFQFKYVPGDFQMAVHINALEANAYNQPGLLARAYCVDTNGNIGAPFGLFLPNGNGTNDLGEYWVSFCRFEEYGIGTYPRLNLDSVVLESIQLDQGDGTFWLLMVRSQGTNFSFYKRATNNVPWLNIPLLTSYQAPEFAGQPMQVGLMSGAWWQDGGITSRSVWFEHFMLDKVTGSPLQITHSGATVTLSWPAIAGTVQHTTSLSPANWQPVGGIPVLGTNGYSLTIPRGAGPDFFRLVQ